MKIVCKTADLKTALAFTSKVINRNSILPILEGYLIEGKGKALTITTTDLETRVTKGFAATIAEPFPFVLDSLAASFIKAMTGEEITLNIDSNFAITVNCGNKIGKFMAENSKDYPVLPVVESDTAYSITDEFQTGIEKSLKYLSTDSLRPAMTGLFFGKDEICATDAHMLYVYKHGLNLPDSFICQQKAAQLMVKLKDCKMKCQSGNSTVYVSFNNKSTLITTRAIEARFPDYKVVIPQDNTISWKVNKAEFKEAINTVTIAANQSTKQVSLLVKKSETILSAQDVDFGMEATDTLKSKCSVPDFSIAFNSTFLLYMVADTKGEEVELLFKNSSTAAIVKQDKELILLMPLMLNGGGSSEKAEPKKATKAEAVKEAEEENDLKDINDLDDDESIAQAAAEEAKMD